MRAFSLVMLGGLAALIGQQIAPVNAEPLKKQASVVNTIPWDDDLHGGGVFVTHPKTKQVVCMYNTTEQGAVLGFHVNPKVDQGCRFAVMAQKDGVFFQIIDERNDIHMIPVTDLLKLKSVPRDLPKNMAKEKVSITKDCGCCGKGDCQCFPDCKCGANKTE